MEGMLVHHVKYDKRSKLISCLPMQKGCVARAVCWLHFASQGGHLLLCSVRVFMAADLLVPLRKLGPNHLAFFEKLRGLLMATSLVLERVKALMAARLRIACRTSPSASWWI